MVKGRREKGFRKMYKNYSQIIFYINTVIKYFLSQNTPR